MSKKPTIIQHYNDITREFEYNVKGFDITESVKVLLKTHKEAYDTERRIFTECKAYCDAEKEFKQQIADLEAKLAENDKAIENWQTMYQSVMRSCHNSIEEDKRLREQLAEKEKEIEELQHCNERLAQGIYHSYGEHFILKVNQDKISFALKQLDKVKAGVNKTDKNGYLIKFANLDERLKFYKEIDNQIEELKKGL